jgi:hypothetical protein
MIDYQLLPKQGSVVGTMLSKVNPGTPTQYLSYTSWDTPHIRWHADTAPPWPTQQQCNACNDALDYISIIGLLPKGVGTVLSKVNPGTPTHYLNYISLGTLHNRWHADTAPPWPTQQQCTMHLHHTPLMHPTLATCLGGWMVATDQ